MSLARFSVRSSPSGFLRVSPFFPSLVLGFLFVVPDLGAQTSVRILDYNIHRDIGGSDSNTGSQLSLAKVVNYLHPDVWTINELGGNSTAFNAITAHDLLVSFIRADLTFFGPNPQEGRDFYVYVGAINDGFIANAIVSRYPMLSSQTYSDAGGGSPALRGMAQAVVDLPGTNVDLAAFTAHLKASNASSDAAKRQAEAHADAANVSAWMSSHSGGAVVMTGDWNEDLEIGATANWTGHKIGDSLPTTGEAYEPATLMLSPGLTDANPLSVRGNHNTIDSTSPNSRFDYLGYAGPAFALQGAMVFDTKQYTTSELAALNAAFGAGFVAGDSANASDHLPVFAVFQVIPEAGNASLLLVGMGLVGLRRGRSVAIGRITLWRE